MNPELKNILHRLGLPVGYSETAARVFFRAMTPSMREVVTWLAAQEVSG